MEQPQPPQPDLPQPGLPPGDPIRTAPSFRIVRKGFDQEQVLGHLRLVGQRVSIWSRGSTARSATFSRHVSDLSSRNVTAT